MANLYERQNDKDNLKYLWSSDYCTRQRRKIIYFQVILSFMMPVISIINKYMPFLFPEIPDISNISNKLSQIIVLISGFVIILQTVLDISVKRRGLESVVFNELYDIKVFKLFPNRSLLIPISYQNMLIYASKNKKKAALNDYYFKNEQEADKAFAHFDMVKKTFEYDYNIMLEVKSYLVTAWLCFIIMLVIFAFAINPTWMESIIYIFIPSLSAIGMIAKSWNDYKVKMRFLENILHITNEYANQKQDGSTESPNSRILMRSLQDAMYFHRMNDFMIPNFILRNYDKKKQKELLKALPLPPVITNTEKTKNSNKASSSLIAKKETDINKQGGKSKIIIKNTENISQNNSSVIKCVTNAIKSYYGENKEKAASSKQEALATIDTSTKKGKNKQAEASNIEKQLASNNTVNAVIEKRQPDKAVAKISTKPSKAEVKPKNTVNEKTVKPKNINKTENVSKKTDIKKDVTNKNNSDVKATKTNKKENNNIALVTKPKMIKADNCTKSEKNNMNLMKSTVETDNGAKKTNNAVKKKQTEKKDTQAKTDGTSDIKRNDKSTKVIKSTITNKISPTEVKEIDDKVPTPKANKQKKTTSKN